MTRSPDSLIPSAAGQPTVEKRDDKVSVGRTRGEANPRAATQVNAVSASSTPPANIPAQLDLFPRRTCPLKVKPATDRTKASRAARRDGVQGGGTRRKPIRITGETLFGPAWEEMTTTGREAYKGDPRSRRPKARQGVGGGRSTVEARDNRVKGRTATSTTRSKRGKTTGLRPRGKARSRSKSVKKSRRMDNVRKLQRTLYRVAKSQPERRFTKLYDKVYRRDVLQEAWRRVRSNRGAAGVDKVGIEEVEAYGVERFIDEIAESLRNGTYRASPVRRVHIPKPGQPGRTRPLGIPTVKDRVVQMAVKLVIEPLFEVDFRPCSYGFRPKKTSRMALSSIVKAIDAGYRHVVDVDLASYFDNIDQKLLIGLVEKKVGDVRTLRLIRGWLRAGVMEEGKVTSPTRGTPQGGVISPLLSNIYLHEVDRQWCEANGAPSSAVRLVRYADDMVLMARSSREANRAWERLQEQLEALGVGVNHDKSQLTTVEQGFSFLGFEFRRKRSKTYMFPRAKSIKNLGLRVRRVTRSFRSSARLDEVIRALNRVLTGWCTYFRVGNSNRVFHKVDEMARSELQLWLRRKHRCTWRKARGRWGYRYLHERCRLYRLVGKVSHLDGLRRTPPKEGGRRAVCGKTARTVR